MNKDDILAHFSEHFTYNPETGSFRRKDNGGELRTYNHEKGYLFTSYNYQGKKRTIYLHRLAWALTYGRWPTIIDHINGVKTDNRLCNLRDVGDKESCENRMVPWVPNEKTGLPGVFDCIVHLYRINFSSTFAFTDKYEAFHAIILLGRMFCD